jgi:RNA polymerase sigma-70 factor (ECF subfamily)
MIAQETTYRTWMLAALGGDGHAYRQLLTALTRHLRAYFARRLDAAAAEDAVQETLIALHARRATYDPALPFTAWVHGIARYKLMDEYRRRKRQASVPLDESQALFAAEETEAMLARRDVVRLLDRLPEDKRALVAAWKVDGDSLAEIAVRAGMSESAVKVAIHRALKFLGDDLVTADAHR